MRFFWQRKPHDIEVLVNALPSQVILGGKQWGLRIKRLDRKDNMWVVRYVTSLTDKERKKKRKLYDSFGADPHPSLLGAIKNMHEILRNLKKKNLVEYDETKTSILK